MFYPIIPIIVQARTTSSRCPGKVMRVVNGRRLIDFTLEPLKRCQTTKSIIVATSHDPSDDALADHCRRTGAAVMRGDLKDVAGRFVQALELFPAEAFVRICADSPMIDYRLVDQAVNMYRQSSADLVTNVQYRSFPKGQSVEVVRSETFLKAVDAMIDSNDREHVTQFMYRNPLQYEIVNFAAEENYGDRSLAIDTEEEFDRFHHAMSRLSRPPSDLTWLDHVNLIHGLDQPNWAVA